MKDNILVSILCLTYNHEKYIKEAIESFLNQKTKFRYEILIHDDASIDNTSNILKEYEKKYNNLMKVIYQKENQYSKGKSPTHILLKEAKGKYIAICEGDDYWCDETKLQKQVDYLEKDQKCGLCFHSVDIFDDKQKKIIGTIRPYKENCISKPKDIILGGGEFIGTNSIVCRKDYLLPLPQFYIESPVGDYPLQILTGSKEHSYFFKESMSVYRTNIHNSWTNNNKGFQKKIKLSLGLIKMLEEYNRFSHFKYKNIVKRKIEMISYECVNYYYKDIVNLTKDEYEYFFHNLRVRIKIKIYIKFLIKKMKTNNIILIK